MAIARVQKYQRTGAARQYANVVLVVLQLVVLSAYCLTLLYTARLPSSLRQGYDVYNDAEAAAARPLLPFKVTPPVLAGNTSALLAGNDSDALECGVDVLGSSFVPPVDIPRWALPTDNSGLSRLLQNQVLVEHL